MTAATAPLGDDEAAAALTPLQDYRHIALAVSGGADSSALLDLVARWHGGGAGRPAVTVLSVDHGLRPAAAAECRQVVAWAGEAGFAAEVLTVAGPAPASGLQDWARQARYRLLLGWCRKHDAGALVTAHTLDDQAETVLMRLARGSGIDGLSGMAPVIRRDGIDLVRPLLGVSRQRLVCGLERRGRRWIEDPSNEDCRFERVRWRRLAGELAAAGLTADALALSAARAGRARAALDADAAALLVRSTTWYATGHGEIALESLSRAAPEIRLRALIAALRAANNGAEIALSGAERLLHWLDHETSPARTFAGCRLQRRSRLLVVSRDPGRIAAAPTVLSPGRETCWDGRFAVSLAEAGAEPVAVAALDHRLGTTQLPGAKGLPASVRRSLPAILAGERVVAVPALGYRAPDGPHPVLLHRLARLPAGLSATRWPASGR